MTRSKTILSVGEAMIEFSAGKADLWKLGYAGDTLNTAWYLRALLGQDWTVAYYTGLGTDRMSRDLTDFIRGAGIEPRIVTVPERRPGLYMIHQENGDRQFTYWRDQSAAKLLAHDAAALREAFSDASILYFSGISIAILARDHRRNFLEAVAEKRRTGTRICFDPNIRPVLWKDDKDMAFWLTEAARHASVILPTFGDEQILFGDADTRATAARYLAAGAEEVIVKDGGNPALVAFSDQFVAIPAPSGVTIVDATGAGDSFNGGYLAARLSGHDPQAATVHAHQVAAINLGIHGALVTPEKLAGLLFDTLQGVA